MDEDWGFSNDDDKAFLEEWRAVGRAAADTRQVLSTAFLVLTPAWQDLRVLDEDVGFTERGGWGLPRALHRSWSR